MDKYFPLLILFLILYFLTKLEKDKKDKDGDNSEKKETKVQYVKKRQSYHCDFSGGISLKEFKDIVIFCSSDIHRLKVRITGPVVNGSVLSMSGMSTWQFKLDFNDYGKLTGKYWIYSDNEESEIPDNLAYKISEIIKERKYRK